MDDLRKAHEVAVKHVRASRLTDAELIYTPSQIALACFSLASAPIASAWARSKHYASSLSPSPDPSSPTPDTPILDLIEPIKEMVLRDGSPPEVEAVREVDRRLRLCKNPEKIPGTNAYRKKQAEIERKAAEKRARKIELVKRSMAGGDPFGHELGSQEFDDEDDDD